MSTFVNRGVKIRYEGQDRVGIVKAQSPTGNLLEVLFEDDKDDTISAIVQTSSFIEFVSFLPTIEEYQS